MTGHDEESGVGLRHYVIQASQWRIWGRPMDTGDGKFCLYPTFDPEFPNGKDYLTHARGSHSCEDVDWCLAGLSCRVFPIRRWRWNAQDYTASQPRTSQSTERPFRTLGFGNLVCKWAHYSYRHMSHEVASVWTVICFLSNHGQNLV
jgi:hypothetical protein